MFGMGIGIAMQSACSTCLQPYEVWEYEDSDTNKLEFKNKPSLHICPSCFRSVGNDVVSTQAYFKRWKKAASKIFR